MPKIIKKYGKAALILGLILVLVLMYLAIPTGQAASISSRKTTISDSRPSQTGVIYDFEGTHSGSTVKCLEISFCTSATGTCTGPTGFTAAGGAKDSSNWNGWTVNDWTGSFIATRVRYDDATGETGGAAYSFSTSGITNPSATSTYYARVASYSDTGCTTGVDSGVTAFAILYGVSVSATVAETLNFAVGSVTNDNCDTYFGVLAGPNSTSSSVAYGELSSTDTFYHACNDLTVSTNAGNGYAVTGQETTSLYDSGTDTTIDDAGVETSMSESATDLWATTTDNGFGYACADISGSDCSMTSTSWYREFACMSSTDSECNPGSGSETAQTLMENAGDVSGNQSRIEYKVNVSGTQAAGSYSNTIVYIATPTY